MKSGKVVDCGDGLYVQVKIQGKPVNFLIDTGANITIIKPEVLESIPSSERPTLEAVKVNMVLANGGSAPFIGSADFKLQVGDVETNHRVLCWIVDLHLPSAVILLFNTYMPQGMFHQVRLPDTDPDLLRFLWWPNGNLDKELEEFQMMVHLFGAVSSPSCANFALRKTAEDNKEKFNPEVINTVHKNFYVDDCLKSVPTIVTAMKR